MAEVGYDVLTHDLIFLITDCKAEWDLEKSVGI